MTQPPLIPIPCSFCDQFRVCGLRSRSRPGLVLDVCAVHFKKVTGRKWTKRDAAQLLAVSA